MSCNDMTGDTRYDGKYLYYHYHFVHISDACTNITRLLCDAKDPLLVIDRLASKDIPYSTQALETLVLVA